MIDALRVVIVSWCHRFSPLRSCCDRSKGPSPERKTFINGFSAPSRIAVLPVASLAIVFDLQETFAAGFTRNCLFALSHSTLNLHIDVALIACRNDLIRVQSHCGLKKALQLYGSFSRENQVFS